MNKNGINYRNGNKLAVVSFSRLLVIVLSILLINLVQVRAVSLPNDDNANAVATVTKSAVPGLLFPVTAPGVSLEDNPLAGEGFKFEWDVKGIKGQPYLVCVNRAACTVTVYGKDSTGNYTVPVRVMPCSVGRKGHGTPKGTYKTGKNRYEWRLMVDGTYARCAIGVYKGIMFHSVGYYTPNLDDLEYDEFNKLGSPASLGCIRLCYADAYWLFNTLPVGFTAVIYDNADVPGPLGRAQAIKIDTSNEILRKYDPTELLMNLQIQQAQMLEKQNGVTNN